MKSKLIRVKVWYEHADRAKPEEITRDLEAALSSACKAAGEHGAVTIRQVDVGNTPGNQQRRPEPDF